MSVFIDEDLLILRRTANWQFTTIVLNGPMLAILDKIDGVRALGKILREVKVRRDLQEDAVINLLDRGLVEIKNLEHVFAKPLKTSESKGLAAGRLAL
jgi:hypothetical protein